jgi:hypothetical protein
MYGGVDFTHIPKKQLSVDEFAKKRPALRNATVGALSAPTVEAGKDKTWLGGRSSERPRSSPYPKPASPLGTPVFYVLTPLPVLAWLIIGGYLLRRRRRLLATAPATTTRVAS